MSRFIVVLKHDGELLYWAGENKFHRSVEEAVRTTLAAADDVAKNFGGWSTGAPEFSRPISEIYENGGLRCG